MMVLDLELVSNLLAARKAAASAANMQCVGWSLVLQQVCSPRNQASLRDDTAGEHIPT